MPANYVLLEKIVVGAAGAASVTFANIPQTGYSDLVIKASTRNTGPGTNNLIGLTINSSSSNLSNIYFFGNPNNTPTVSSGSIATVWAVDNDSTTTSSSFTNNEIYIPNYLSATNKSISINGVQSNNAANMALWFSAGLWLNTSAITSLTLTPYSAGSFAQFSTFYLYGVAKLGTTPAIAPKAAGGDTIMTDGTYWYHAFKSSSTFTPALNMSADVLVVAGGGGGGTGGGGAGGLLYFTNQSLTNATATTITVGAGGVGMDVTGYLGMTNGGNSQFGALTASVGGGAGKSYSTDGNSGGSGGGAAVGATRVGGAGTTSQGNAGGANLTANYSAGGGGGAGAVGQAGQTNKGGNGGVGINTYSSWASVTGTGDSGYFAGGGGGGFDYRFANYSASTGGTGGGGAGNTTTNNGIAGTANTGGGGGAGNVTGGSTYSAAGNGGSGLVIVRYTVA